MSQLIITSHAWCVSRADSTLVSIFAVTDIGLCDDNGIIVKNHYALTLEINETFEKSSYKTVSYRKLRDINVETFKQDIRNSASLNSTNGSANQLAMNYVNGLNMLKVIEKWKPYTPFTSF